MPSMRTDIGAYRFEHTSVTSPTADNTEGHEKDLDVLIVGAGFSGVYLLHKLRERGFNVKIVEAGSGLGGVWLWNCYPGARVDSVTPMYSFSMPEIWKTWTWSSKYPDRKEIKKYFDHVDKVLDISKDVSFNTKVVAAEFNKTINKWIVETESGRTIKGTYLILATGFATKRYIPDWKGVDTFKGTFHHSSFWPEVDVNVSGKRVAVIGTGSTGVQLTQEIGKEAAELNVFQRTPNLALPMQQRQLTADEQNNEKDRYSEFFRRRRTTPAGLLSEPAAKRTFDDSPEEREKFYQQLWNKGGFEFLASTYCDLLVDRKANDEAYKFWCKKVRERIKDEATADILAPLRPPHAIGTKRPSLEQDYYEQFNKPNVHIVDINENPIREVVPEGIITEDGKLHKVEIIALATGFDAITGGIKSIAIKSWSGELLADKWKMGTWTYLGLMTSGFPNMMFIYGPQGPTALGNGPTIVEVQGDWIVDAIVKLKEQGAKCIEPTKDAETKWREHVNELSDMTLFSSTNSWYMGANIPGKPREQLNYAGGVPTYERTVRDALNNWDGFVFA